jgi:hypothetical protein
MTAGLTSPAITIHHEQGGLGAQAMLRPAAPQVERCSHCLETNSLKRAHWRSWHEPGTNRGRSTIQCSPLPNWSRGQHHVCSTMWLTNMVCLQGAAQGGRYSKAHKAVCSRLVVTTCLSCLPVPPTCHSSAIRFISTAVLFVSLSLQP